MEENGNGRSGIIFQGTRPQVRLSVLMLQCSIHVTVNDTRYDLSLNQQNLLKLIDCKTFANTQKNLSQKPDLHVCSFDVLFINMIFISYIESEQLEVKTKYKVETIFNQCLKNHKMRQM